MHMRVLAVLNENDGDEFYSQNKDEIEHTLEDDLTHFIGSEFDYWSLYPEDDAAAIFGTPITEENYPAPMKSLTKDILTGCYAVVVDGMLFCCERFEPWRKEKKFILQSLPPLSYLNKKHPNALLVLVDIHR